MGPRNFGNQEENFIFSKPPEKSLLSAGWRPLHRQIDWGYMWELASNNPWEITQKTVDVTSEIADALGRKDYAWWANIINVFSNYTRNEIDEFWDYITPKPPEPDYNNNDMLSTLTPVMQFVSRDSIPIDYVLSRLLEITILKVLDLLGKPDMITQTYQGRSFYYPIEKFVNWQRIESMGMVLAY